MYKIYIKYDGLESWLDFFFLVAVVDKKKDLSKFSNRMQGRLW